MSRRHSKTKRDKRAAEAVERTARAVRNTVNRRRFPLDAADSGPLPFDEEKAFIAGETGVLYAKRARNDYGYTQPTGKPLESSKP